MFIFKKIQRIIVFVNTCIIKEFISCLRHVWYRCVYFLHPHIYGLDPKEITPILVNGRSRAKVILCLHASGAHPSSFIPLCKKLTDEGFKNIFTVFLKASKANPVPDDSVQACVERIKAMCTYQEIEEVEFIFIGHSLGALTSAKYIWNPSKEVRSMHISKMISLAGRLKYIKGKFSWFCEDERESIKETYKEIVQHPTKVSLFSLWGSRDAIVPKGSAHIHGAKCIEVKGWGHGGLVFSKQAHDYVCAILTQEAVS